VLQLGPRRCALPDVAYLWVTAGSVLLETEQGARDPSLSASVAACRFDGTLQLAEPSAHVEGLFARLSTTCRLKPRAEIAQMQRGISNLERSAVSWRLFNGLMHIATHDRGRRVYMADSQTRFVNGAPQRGADR
jgi:hypothetical protein